MENPLCQENVYALKAAGSSLSFRTDHRFYYPCGDIWSQQYRQNLTLLPLILYQTAYILNWKTFGTECVISDHRFFLSKATMFEATVETTRDDCSFTWDGARSTKIARGGQAASDRISRERWYAARLTEDERSPEGPDTNFHKVNCSVEKCRFTHTESCDGCSRTRGRPHPGVAALSHFSEQVILCLRSVGTKEYRGHGQRWRDETYT